MRWGMLSRRWQVAQLPHSFVVSGNAEGSEESKEGGVESACSVDTGSAGGEDVGKSHALDSLDLAVQSLPKMDVVCDSSVDAGSRCLSVSKILEEEGGSHVTRIKNLGLGRGKGGGEGFWVVTALSTTFLASAGTLALFRREKETPQLSALART